MHIGREEKREMEGSLTIGSRDTGIRETERVYGGGR